MPMTEQTGAPVTAKGIIDAFKAGTADWPTTLAALVAHQFQPTRPAPTADDVLGKNDSDWWNDVETDDMPDDSVDQVWSAYMQDVITEEQYGEYLDAKQAAAPAAADQ